MLDKIEKQAIPNEDDVYWVELDDIYNLVKEMVADAKIATTTETEGDADDKN